MRNKKEYQTISDYIDNQPEGAREALNQLRAFILEATPGATELFNYGIPAFALVKGGKREQQIMMAGYKKHVGLYPHPTVMKKFSKELKEYKQGKGSVQFPVNKPLPKDLIIRMITYRMRLLEKRNFNPSQKA